MANDLGYTEATIAAILGHAAGTTTSQYMHHLDEVLIASAEKVSTHIADLLGAREAEEDRLRDMFKSWEKAATLWMVAAE